MKSVHKPIRECISCGQKFLKSQLLRVVKNESGIYADPTGKAAGRGAYLCKNPACLEKLVAQKRLNRAFKQRVKAEVYEAVAQQLVSSDSEQNNPGQ